MRQRPSISYYMDLSRIVKGHSPPKNPVMGESRGGVKAGLDKAGEIGIIKDRRAPLRDGQPPMLANKKR